MEPVLCYLTLGVSFRCRLPFKKKAVNSGTNGSDYQGIAEVSDIRVLDPGTSIRKSRRIKNFQGLHIVLGKMRGRPPVSYRYHGTVLSTIRPVYR